MSGWHNNLDIGCCCNIQYQAHTGWHQFLDDLETSMQTSQESPACMRCYQEESNGYQSERVRALLQLDQETFEQYAAGVRIQQHEIGIKLGNLCPLACRSCKPSESTTYGKITKTQPQNPGQSDVFAHQESFDWIKKQLRWVWDNYSNPTIHLIGGETLVQPSLYLILDWLVQQNMAQKFTVAMTTSLGVNLTDRLKDCLWRFNHISLSLSIDSVGENFHYVRWPSRFDKIEQNLSVLRDWIIESPKLFLSLNPVFSISNIFYLDQYLDYWHQYESYLPIWPIHLYEPEHLAVENIPPEYQPRLLSYLEDVMQHNYFDRDQTQTLRQQIQSFCDSKLTQDDDVFCYAMAWMSDYDKRTGLTMAQYNSRLWNMLNDKHRNIYQDQYNLANTMISIHESLGHDFV